MLFTYLGNPTMGIFDFTGLLSDLFDIYHVYILSVLLAESVLWMHWRTFAPG